MKRVPCLVEPRRPSIPDSVEAVAEKSAIIALADWAEAWASSHHLGRETAHALRLCVEEAVTNIVFYAYDGVEAARTVSAAAARTADGVTLTITDQGRPFDVAAAPDPGLETDLLTATAGGRGIRLMRAFAETLAYERLGARNRLTLTFLTSPTPANASGPDR
jgi:serine/threonine-protein kinase RsbW